MSVVLKDMVDGRVGMSLCFACFGFWFLHYWRQDSCMTGRAAFDRFLRHWILVMQVILSYA